MRSILARGSARLLLRALQLRGGRRRGHRGSARQARTRGRRRGRRARLRWTTQRGQTTSERRGQEVGADRPGAVEAALSDRNRISRRSAIALFRRMPARPLGYIARRVAGDPAGASTYRSPLADRSPQRRKRHAVATSDNDIEAVDEGAGVIMYCRSWCGDCAQGQGVAHGTQHPVHRDRRRARPEARDRAAAHNDGRLHTPTFEIGDGVCVDFNPTRSRSCSTSTSSPSAPA